MSMIMMMTYDKVIGKVVPRMADTPVVDGRHKPTEWTSAVPVSLSTKLN